MPFPAPPATAPVPVAGKLPLDHGHVMHYETLGAADGLPVLVLHGGPGSGFGALHRSLLDPARHRIVLFDQRGCGQSTPYGVATHNTTSDLLADAERLRQHLGIPQWLIFGGSWGASLAVALAAQAPEHCLGVYLRGSFLTGAADLEWFFDGAGALLPEAHEALVRAAFADADADADDDVKAGAVATPPTPSARLLHALHARLHGADVHAAIQAARAWQHWEIALSGWHSAPAGVRAPVGPRCSGGSDDAPLPANNHPDWSTLVGKYRVQSHYLVHDCFLGETRLLADAARLSGIPVALVHGRLDLICRPRNAQALLRALPEARLWWVDGCGHDPGTPAMREATAAALAWLESVRHSSRALP